MDECRKCSVQGQACMVWQAWQWCAGAGRDEEVKEGVCGMVCTRQMQAGVYKGVSAKCKGKGKKKKKQSKHNEYFQMGNNGAGCQHPVPPPPPPPFSSFSQFLSALSALFLFCFCFVFLSSFYVVRQVKVLEEVRRERQREERRVVGRHETEPRTMQLGHAK